MQEVQETLGWKDPWEEEAATAPVLVPRKSQHRGAWWATVHVVSKTWHN